MNSIRTKLTLALVGASLVAIGVVGITARTIMVRRFHQLVLQRAFGSFEQDIIGYYDQYGSWEAAAKGEPFDAYVRALRPGAFRTRPAGPGGSSPQAGMRSRPMGRAGGPGQAALGRPAPRRRPGAPATPPRFLVVDTTGRVLVTGGGHHAGDVVPIESRADLHPIYDGSEIIGYGMAAAPPAPTPMEERYLAAIRNSWELALALALLLAVPVGFLLGGQLAEPIQEMTRAIHAMAGGNLRQSVTVRSKDEVGELAETFNRMSSELADAYEELERSHARISEQAASLADLSRTDELTGLANRRSFDDAAGKLCDQATRYGHPLSVGMIDIDRFKAINDRFSHATGDAVLRGVAETLRNTFRSVDVVARYGGEEFTIAFPETPLDQAALLAERLRASIHDYDWASIAPDLRVTVSVGLSGLDGAGSLEDLLQRADARLYESKRAGRDRVSW